MLVEIFLCIFYYTTTICSKIVFGEIGMWFTLIFIHSFIFFLFLSEKNKEKEISRIKKILEECSNRKDMEKIFVSIAGDQLFIFFTELQKGKIINKKLFENIKILVKIKRSINLSEDIIPFLTFTTLKEKVKFQLSREVDSLFL